MTAAYVVHSFPAPVVVIDRSEGAAYVAGTTVAIASPSFAQFGNAFITKQEFPYHPGSRLTSELHPTQPFSLITSAIVTRQESPSHPGSQLFFGIGPTTSHLEITSSFITRQETPYHPDSRMRASIQGPNVAPPPHIGAVLTRQEQPFHPSSAFTSSFIRGNVAALPQIGKVQTAQELPSHPLPSMVAGAAFVAPLGTLFPFNPILISQETPYHPSSRFTPSFIVGNVAPPPHIGKVQTTQEQPFHPQPSLGSSFIPGPIPPVLLSPLLVRQEPWSRTPLRFVFGVYLNAPTPTLGISLIQNQELPKQPLPVLTAGASFVAAPIFLVVQTPIMVPQKVPDHPSSLLSNSISFTVTNQVEFNGIFMGAEEPIPVAPILSPSPLLGLPPIVLSAEYRAIIVTQRLPDHPASRLGIGIQGPNVAPPPHIGSVFIKQEQPYHPLPSFNPALPPLPPPVPPVGRAIGSQEQPYHPPSQFWNYPPTSVPFFGIGTQLVTVQEYPYHPPSMLFFTGYTPEFASPGPNIGRLLFNTKVRVRILSNKNPRTIRYS